MHPLCLHYFYLSKNHRRALCKKSLHFFEKKLTNHIPIPEIQRTYIDHYISESDDTTYHAFVINHLRSLGKAPKFGILVTHRLTEDDCVRPSEAVLFLLSYPRTKYWL